MIRVGIISLLVLVNICIFSLEKERQLTVSFLNVGQGDAILVESPSGTQMLIDGGRDKSVLRELGRELPFFDRSIDVVVATHMDEDHIGGLPDVFDRYQITTFIDSGVQGESAASQILKKAIDTEDVKHVLARSGVRIVLGDGAYADVLYPVGDVSNIESNTGSIILRVVYGENEFMLTGDAPSVIEGLLVSKYGVGIESDVLKVGHHGSKTSSNPYFIDSVNPQYAVFSRGCANRYGHPAEEVVARFTSKNINIFDTCEDGTITFHSNGKQLSVK